MWNSGERDDNGDHDQDHGDHDDKGDGDDKRLHKVARGFACKGERGIHNKGRLASQKVDKSEKNNDTTMMHT